jgi:hypothetical protein
MDSLINPKTGKPIVNNVRRKVIDKHYDWGLYVYKKSTGKWFTDGSGSVLNIPAQKGDISKIAELKREAISYGVIKMNIDTDLQFAFTEGIRDYMVNHIEYLKTQIGNPDGADVPNKKYYDPRKWVREGEMTFNKRLEQAFADLNNVNTL